jgi:hypothetical protein
MASSMARGEARNLFTPRCTRAMKVARLITTPKMPTAANFRKVRLACKRIHQTLTTNSMISARPSLVAPRSRSMKSTGISRNPSQQRAADGPEAGGAILDSIESGQIAGAEVAPAGDGPPQPTPIFGDAAAGNVAAADDEVGALIQDRQQPGDVGGLMGEIGVHLHDRLGVKFLQGISHSPDIGGAQALFLTGEEVQIRISGHQLPDGVGGAVRRVVIHHQYVHFVFEIGELLP